MQLTFSELKNEFNILRDSGDPWGSCMSMFFSVASEMWWRGLDIPAAWGYSPGMTSDPRQLDDLEAQVCLEATDEALEAMGDFLHRYAELIKKAGRDY